ncbi:phycobilisome linker polypeptide [Allocoleopsis sp.]|uniref:phycobilisome linker polypeptide n=1 Tax=Allocoleopsis sp. TaxID=3088169 RepID=UPI002FD6987F
MLGSIVGGSTSSSPSSARCFRYEVVGLRQSVDTDNTDYPIRSSASVFITVPYNRMNEEMQRITRLGGKIVSIQPLTSEGESASESEG